MAKVKKQYEVVDDFPVMANKLVQKYPEEFPLSSEDVDGIRCVKITNKDPKEDNSWKTIAVSMPMLIDSPFKWYVIIYASDWDSYGEKQKAWMIADILHSIDKDDDGCPIVVPKNTKLYAVMARTCHGIDFMDDSSLPDPIEETIEWQHDPIVGSKQEKELS